MIKGLCNKKLGLYEDALEDFFKLHSIVRNHSEVVYQLANLYEVMGDMDQAIEWYLQLLGLTPTDPVILQKMGAIFDNEGDKQQAYQYHFDSYRFDFRILHTFGILHNLNHPLRKILVFSSFVTKIFKKIVGTEKTF